MRLSDAILEGIKKASTSVPDFVKRDLEEALKGESDEVQRAILAALLENIKLAEEAEVPLCQDTGIPVFFVRPRWLGTAMDEIAEAVDRAVEEGFLRKNAIDPLTGEERMVAPEVHVTDSLPADIAILLRGGGASYVSRLYSIPPIKGSAEIANVLEDAVAEAGGKPCPPVYLGVGLGGTEAAAMVNAQLALLKIPHDNPLRIYLRRLNALGMGAMGLPGRTYVLDIGLAISPRHPATFLVGVSVNCWALRRAFIRIVGRGVKIWK